MRATLARVVGVGVASLIEARAYAASFDAQGELHFEEKAVATQSFEEAADGGASDAGDQPTRVEDPGALHGSHVLHLEEFGQGGFAVPMPTQSRKFGARLWAKGEVVATIEIQVEGRVEDFGVFYPTGRMTSDGWYELALHELTIDVSRAEEVAVGLFAPGGGDVDAFELVPEGEPVFGASCLGAQDTTSCDGTQICTWGRCRNMASRVPPVPADEWRNDVIDYIDQRFELLFGPFENRKLDLPTARLEIDAMRNEHEAWHFWRHFRVAVNRLHDWHTRGSDLSGFLAENPRPIGVCFIEGKADLSANVASTPGYLDILVSHVGSANTFGLAPGDRLVSIDGKHPIEWARSLIQVDYAWESASNHSTQAEPVARLNRLIAAFANHIEVLHCDAATKTCAAKPETISIVDLPASPLGTSTGISCDNRPILHLPDAPPSHPLGGFFTGIVKESNSTERIYGLQWSSLAVGLGANIGPLLEQAVVDWRASARGVILDHRTGFGGTNAGPPIFWNFVRNATPLDVFSFRQRADEVGPNQQEGKTLFDQLMMLGYVEIAGGDNPALDVPVALLVHLDGSASDWLPLGFKGAPKAKVFGPYATAGAFSTLFSFGYWFGLGYSIAVGDTLHSSGQMLNGHGVEPDVIVVQLQSDLLAGKDTIYDTALAWVRSELKP